jgi:hypothetical protein
MIQLRQTSTSKAIEIQKATQVDTAGRHRRTEDERIAALRTKIEDLERRRQRKAMRESPVAKAALDLVRRLKRAETLFLENSRMDLANSAKAASISLTQLMQERMPRPSA